MSQTEIITVTVAHAPQAAFDGEAAKLDWTPTPTELVQGYARLVAAIDKLVAEITRNGPRDVLFGEIIVTKLDGPIVLARAVNW